MKKYEKPAISQVLFCAKEQLMLSDLDEGNGLSLQGIIGYSLKSNQQAV